MRCAVINNNIVENIAEVNDGEIFKYPDLILIGDILVDLGDSYIDGTFYRNGEKVLTGEEMLGNIIMENDQIIAELDAALLDITYENIVGGLE